MALRFRRSIKIAPGVRWNVGLKSSSLSFGPRGAKLTAGTRGTRATIGLPGTGLSYTATSGTGRRGRSTAAPSESGLAPTFTITPRVDPTRFGVRRFPTKLVVGVVSLVLLITGEPGVWVGVLGLCFTIAIPSRQSLAKCELALRVGKFRDALKSAGEGVGEVQRMVALREELELLPNDVPIETEMLEGLKALCEFEARGALPALGGHEALSGPEPCHFVAKAFLDKRGLDEHGEVCITATRVIFQGSQRTEIPLKKVALCDLDIKTRSLRVQRSDRQTPMSFQFATMGDALIADAVAKKVRAVLTV